MLQTALPLRLSLCMHSCILPNQCRWWFFTKEVCIYSLSTGQSSLSLFVHSSGVRPPASCNLDVKGVYFRNVHFSTQRVHLCWSACKTSTVLMRILCAHQEEMGTPLVTDNVSSGEKGILTFWSGSYQSQHELSFFSGRNCGIRKLILTPQGA